MAFLITTIHSILLFYNLCYVKLKLGRSPALTKLMNLLNSKDNIQLRIAMVTKVIFVASLLCTG